MQAATRRHAKPALICGPAERDGRPPRRLEIASQGKGGRAGGEVFICVFWPIDWWTPPGVPHFLDNASSVAAVSRCRRPVDSKRVQFAPSSRALAFKVRNRAANRPTAALGCILLIPSPPSPPPLPSHMPNRLETDSALQTTLLASLVVLHDRSFSQGGGHGYVCELRRLPLWSSQVRLEQPG